MEQITVNPINATYHTADNFREQIATLHPLEVRGDEVIFLRSYYNVCLSTSASFDKEKPGSDSINSWNNIMNMIDNENVRGIFHTHPAGFDQFSTTDWRSMKAFAKAFGRKLIWYGIQSLGSNTAKFVCLQMLDDRIFTYIYDPIETDPSDVLIHLKLPMKVDIQEDMYIIGVI